MKRALLFLSTVLSGLALAESPKESDYYPITTLPIPEGVVLEVSGIEILPNQKIAVASRRGDIYTLTGAYDSDPSKVQYQLFAEGVHESLGLAYKDGWLYATQRPEVSRLRDSDGGGGAQMCADRQPVKVLFVDAGKPGDLVQRRIARL